MCATLCRRTSPEGLRITAQQKWVPGKTAAVPFQVVIPPGSGATLSERDRRLAARHEERRCDVRDSLCSWLPFIGTTLQYLLENSPRALLVSAISRQFHAMLHKQWQDSRLV